MNIHRKATFLYVAIFSFCVMTFSCSNVFSETIQPGANAEWNRAEIIIMQPPSIADFWISIFPKGNGYDTPFDYPAARNELLNYIDKLNHNDIEVYTVENVLLDGTLDKDGNTIIGEKLNKLREFAKTFLDIKLKNVDAADVKEIVLYKNKAIASLSPDVLVKLILQNPVLTVTKDTKSISGFYCDYALEPLIDLFYTRDQVATTAKGIVVCKFAKGEVANEVKVVKFVLDKLGIEPIYEIQGGGSLEGGDLFMADGLAFIGEGLRTNAEGIIQLMDNDVLGVEKVVVVKDHLLEPAQMHLDTYFNIMAPNLAVMSVERMLEKDGGVCDSFASTVDVYELVNGAYVRKEKNRDFKDYLENELNYKVIPVSVKDQRALATNFLTIAPYRIVGPDGVSQEYKDALKKEGITAEWVDMTNIVRGFGAARCTTQPLVRTK